MTQAPSQAPPTPDPPEPAQPPERTATAEPAPPAPSAEAPAAAPRKKPRRRWPWVVLAGIVLLLIAARAALPTVLQWYVNRTLDRSPGYDGHVGDIDVYLWRGAYSIDGVEIVKTNGQVPVPLFSARRVDLAIQWDAVMAGEVVGRVLMIDPEINFVQGESESDTQTGASGPWMEILDALFPFRINSLLVRNGTVRFRTFHTEPRVDVYINQIEGGIENLSNIHDEVTPLVAEIEARGKAMGQADFELQVRLDPFSYRPTFELAARLLNLDVTQTNDLLEAYGQFDVHAGWFDLVVELDVKEGEVEGSIKPLFRDLRVLSWKGDVMRDNPLQLFWEALVGTASEVFENQPRDQLGTVVRVRGSLDDPRTSLLDIIGNILRNAFVRAYLPRFEGVAAEAASVDVEAAEFDITQ